MSVSIETHLIALSLAFVIDLIVGDPKWLPHPVVAMGKLITLFEKRFNNGKGKKAKGLLFLFLYLAIIVAIMLTVVFLAYSINPIIGIIIEALLIATTIATKGLKEAALEVYVPLKLNDIETARKKLAMIVGRDTETLNEAELVRGTVETVSENTSDGITAPLFYAFIGGSVLAVLYRAVNTCDSMVGYKNERYREYGWASAKLDDVLNFIPSRLTAFVMLLLNRTEQPLTKKQSFAILIRDAKKHPSPNSGWLEAGVAGLMGIQLGGRNTYKGIESLRAKMGDPLNQLTKEHIIMCNKIMVRTCIGFLFTLWLVGGFIYALT